MPTVVLPENRKLAFRKRIRLNKQEAAALEAFLDEYEEGMRSGRIGDCKTEFNYPSTPGVTYLGSGVDKTAYALPGKRYVVKVPRNSGWGRGAFMTADWMEYVQTRLLSEVRIYNRTPEESRHVLAQVRQERAYATLQERAVATVWDYRPKTQAAREKMWASKEEAESIGYDLGIGDLHEQNLAVRADGTVCIIDFSR